MRHAAVGELDIRPRKARVGLAWHCAHVTPLRPKRSRWMLWIWLALSVPAVVIILPLFAGVMARLLRWAVL